MAFLESESAEWLHLIARTESGTQKCKQNQNNGLLFIRFHWVIVFQHKSIARRHRKNTNKNELIYPKHMQINCACSTEGKTFNNTIRSCGVVHLGMKNAKWIQKKAHERTNKQKICVFALVAHLKLAWRIFVLFLLLPVSVKRNENTLVAATRFG